MLNVGCWAARLETPRALPATLSALRAVDGELIKARGTRLVFVPEMVRPPASSRKVNGPKQRPRLLLHFLEMDK